MVTNIKYVQFKEVLLWCWCSYMLASEMLESLGQDIKACFDIRGSAYLLPESGTLQFERSSTLRVKVGREPTLRVPSGGESIRGAELCPSRAAVLNRSSSSGWKKT